MCKRKSHRGFSLLEVMIVLGLMSVIALGYMKLTAQKAKEEKSARVTANIEELVREMTVMLGRIGYCQTTFNNSSIGDQSKISLNEIRDPLNHVVYKVGDTFKQDQIKLTRLELEDFKFDHIEQRTGIGTLRIELERQGDVLGARHLTKEISLSFNLSSDKKVEDCSPLTTPKNTAINLNGIDPNQFLKNNQEEVQKALKKNPELQKAMHTLELINKQLEKIHQEE